MSKLLVILIFASFSINLFAMHRCRDLNGKVNFRMKNLEKYYNFKFEVKKRAEITAPGPKTFLLKDLETITPYFSDLQELLKEAINYPCVNFYEGEDSYTWKNFENYRELLRIMRPVVNEYQAALIEIREAMRKADEEEAKKKAKGKDCPSCEVAEVSEGQLLFFDE